MSSIIIKPRPTGTLPFVFPDLDVSMFQCKLVYLVIIILRMLYKYYIAFFILIISLNIFLYEEIKSGIIRLKILFLAVILGYKRDTHFFYMFYIIKILTALVCEGTVDCLASAYVVTLLF